MKYYSWSPASGLDVSNIVSLTQKNFESEIDTIFKPDPVAYSRNITLAIVKQFFMPNDELVSIAKDDEGNLLAYTWAVRNERAPWSDDEMVVIRMAHLDMQLPIRLRVKLIKEMMAIWEAFAFTCKVPIICSTTMRKDRDGFIKLHEKNNYDIRGSYCYKRLIF